MATQLESHFETVFENRWGSKIVTSFLNEDNSVGQTVDLDDPGTSFTHIQHTTSLENARKIIQQEEMTPKCPADDSICSISPTGDKARRGLQIETHPAQTSMVTWWGPVLPSHDNLNNRGIAHGNIDFSLPVQSIRTLVVENNYNIYYIENLEYSSIIAARFLITYRNLMLKAYNPGSPINGPWWWDDDDVGSSWNVVEGADRGTGWYSSKRIDVEFMLELCPPDAEAQKLKWCIEPSLPGKYKAIRNEKGRREGEYIWQTSKQWDVRGRDKIYATLGAFMLKVSAGFKLQLLIDQVDIDAVVALSKGQNSEEAENSVHKKINEWWHNTHEWWSCGRFEDMFDEVTNIIGPETLKRWMLKLVSHQHETMDKVTLVTCCKKRRVSDSHQNKTMNDAALTTHSKRRRFSE